MQSEQTRMGDFPMPPMYGGIVCLSASTTAVTVDLTTMPGSPGNQVNGVDVSNIGGKNPNALGHFLTVCADGNDLYVAFGDTVNHLSGISNTTAVSTVASNAINAATANGVIKIPASSSLTVKLPVGENPAGTPWAANSPARYLCFLTASGTATLRMWQSSY